MQKDNIPNPYAEVLKEIEAGLWDHDIRVEDNIARPYSYTDESFRACLKIFTSGLTWKLWENMEGQTLEERSSTAEEIGTELRKLILKYTGIDTYKL